MVHRTFPLLVNILMTLAAKLRVHEKIRGNNFAGIRLRRGWSKGRVGAGAFLIHRKRSAGGIFDAVVPVRTEFAISSGAGRQEQKHASRDRVEGAMSLHAREPDAD